MKVVLLERIGKLGQMGDVVNVKPGYARNFLLPRKKALRANKENLTRFEGQRAQLEATNLEKKSEAEKVFEQLSGLRFVVLRQAGETGQLYGSVSTRDIADALGAGGFTVERNQVVLDHPIKTIGLHPVSITLHPEVFATVTVNVARSGEEAERQAAGLSAKADEEDEITEEFLDEEASEEEIEVIVEEEVEA